MMAGTCETCARWKQPRTDFRQVVNLYHPSGEPGREATHMQSDNLDREYGECDAVPQGPVEKEPIPQAVVLDGSEYFAQLYTLPTFGCTLWEQA